MVDLQTAIDELNTGKIEFDYKDDDCCTTEGEVVILLKRLADLEKADLVEVVRCENCNFRGTDDCPRAYWLELEGDYVDPTEDDDFCSYGERKTDNAL